jgi:hypothetical protein
MGDCDFNAGLFDLYYRQTYQEREKHKKKDPEYQKMMAPVRRTHICCVCKKYPGDSEFTLGIWENGKYKCFDCD